MPPVRGSAGARRFAGVAIGLLCLASVSSATAAPDERVTITTVDRATAVRAALRSYVFGTATLPSRQPTVSRGISDGRFAFLPTRRIDRLVVPLGSGFASVSYHLVPRRPRGEVVVYHNGHFQDYGAGWWTMRFLLSRGYAVVAMAMPGYGDNSSPSGVGADHAALANYPLPFRLFIEPVVAVTNWTTRRYRRTSMMGLSGGGWTTVVAAALDTRISNSYPVAGSAPFSQPCEYFRIKIVACIYGRGDYEQIEPSFYAIAGYLDLYVLGASGAARRQLAVFNVYDPCCFAGFGFRAWRSSVQAAVRRLGRGSYAAVGDTMMSEHVVSPWALRRIARDLAVSSDGAQEAARRVATRAGSRPRSRASSRG